MAATCYTDIVELPFARSIQALASVLMSNHLSAAGIYHFTLFMTDNVKACTCTECRLILQYVLMEFIATLGCDKTFN